MLVHVCECSYVCGHECVYVKVDGCVNVYGECLKCVCEDATELLGRVSRPSAVRVKTDLVEGTRSEGDSVMSVNHRPRATLKTGETRAVATWRMVMWRLGFVKASKHE